MKLRDDVGFGSAVTGLADERWCAPDVATVFFTPFDDFQVSLRSFFDLRGGDLHFFKLSMALRTCFSW